MPIYSSLLYNIKASVFNSCGAILAALQDQTGFIIRIMAQKSIKQKRSVYADKISEITGWTHEEALNELRYADSIGIKRSLYYSIKGYEWTHNDLDALAYEMQQKDTREQDSREEEINIIMDDLCCSREEAIKNLRRRIRYKLKKSIFTANGCHRMTDDELKEFAELRKKRLKCIDEIIRADVLERDDPRIEELYRLALPARQKRINEVISFYKGDIDEQLRLQLASDMDYLNLKFGLFLKEFFLYGLETKSRSEIEAFIPNAGRRDYLRKLNSPRAFIICRNKALSYEHLAPLYKRDLVEIKGEEDLQAAVSFIGQHSDFVFKPLDKSFGRGIKRIRSEGKTDAESIAAELIKEAPCILEETVIADETIRSLHSASLNTIRVTTYLDDYGRVTIHLPFFKIGQGGSFVDNGGSGGIFALIDADTGVIISNGKDENNTVYERHPDTGVTLKGFRIPEWDSLKNFAEEAARMFPEARYAGWDMALSADSGWLVVEVNCRTQFYGQQMCDEVGKKSDFEKLINWPDLKTREDEFAEIWETIDRY